MSGTWVCPDFNRGCRESNPCPSCAAKRRATTSNLFDPLGVVKDFVQRGAAAQREVNAILENHTPKPIEIVDTLPSTPESDTSKAAADSMVSKAGNQRRQMWEYIEAQGENGAVYREMKIALGIEGPRLTELRRLGRVTRTGETRKTVSGRQAEIYVVVPRELWPEPQDGWPCPAKPHKLGGVTVRKGEPCTHCGGTGVEPEEG